jgi:hypothetical protein
MQLINRIWSFFLHLSPVRLSALIFVTAFLVRLAIILVFHPYHDMTRLELERTAISLATTGVFGNPYAVPTGPTAHVSPGYPLILAGLFRVFGTGTAAQIVKELLAAVVTSALCAMVPWVASVFRLDHRAGMVAGFVCALGPAKPLVEIQGDWETPYTALFLMLVSIATVRLWREARLSAKNAAAYGFLWGLALLFVGALLPLFLIFLALGAYFCRVAGVSKYARFAAVELAVAALCLAPWIIRNCYALGAPVVTRTNFGLEMRVSNNDFATPNERRNDDLGVYRRYHPLQSPEQALRVRQMGEVAYNRQELSDAKQWIRTHPARFLQLCLGRAREFWFFPDHTSPVKTAYLDLIGALGFVGLILVLRRQPLSGIVLLIILLVYPLPNYLVHVGLRQRFPLDWMLTLLSVTAIVAFLGRARSPQSYTEAAVVSRSSSDAAGC